MHIDKFDQKILAALQLDGGATNQDLSDRVGLSPSQCSRRRTQLEAGGVIQGYSAKLNPDALGLGVTVFISITLARHSKVNSERFRALMERLDEVQEAHSMTGDMDYLVKVTVADLAALSQFINDVLLPHEAVHQVHSTIVLNTIKRNGGLPLSF
ncbi:MAG: Lrp/AsnC family transcriptional regulator [Alphaproteobacteria bacterium]|nr:Lrp/AsnC family transcriptional regulator [Alphaproteobacteria bacterium]